MDATEAVPPGKVPPHLLAELLAQLAPRDPRVLVGPRVGEDAAMIRWGARVLVAAADPITFTAGEIGHYAVAVNANDIAVRGATPRWFLATLLLPEGTTVASIRTIMGDLAAACRALDIDLVGGHTEVTGAVTRPVVAGTMLGEAAPEGLVATGGAQPGDVLLLGGALAIEGTAVLAREAAGLLEERGVAPATLERARNLLREPGISVVAMARALCSAVTPHAMHDPTEGGLATALAEVAAAAGVGVALDAIERVHILPKTRQFCDALGLDPLGLLASGALLAAVAPADAQRALAALATAGPAEIIGRIVSRERGLTMATAAGPLPLPTFPRDELARLLSAWP